MTFRPDRLRRAELSVELDDVLEVRCRICRADVGEVCVPHRQESERWRARHPHRVRVGDAQEATHGERF